MSATSRVIVFHYAVGCSDFVRKFWEAFCVVDKEIQAAFWNTDINRFDLLAAEDYDHRGLTRPQRVSDERTPLDVSHRGTIGWVVIPEIFSSTISTCQMVEVDLILEAKRLKAKSGFIFHGAEGLRSDSQVVRFAYERYMQALLLADAILPVSRIAENEIVRFVVQDQMADYIPSISKVAYPADPAGGSARWIEYVREIRGALTKVGNIARLLTDIWLLDCAAGRNSSSQYTTSLTAAFNRKGICVHRVVWDPRRRQISIAGTGSDAISKKKMPLAESGASCRWLIALHPSSNSMVEALATEAHKHQLQVAAIIDDLADANPEGERPGPDALAQLDKVLASSPESGQALKEMMLGWRGKLVSAETRLQTIPRPNEGPWQHRATAPRIEAVESVRIGVFATERMRPSILKELQHAQLDSALGLEVALSDTVDAKIEKPARFVPIKMISDIADLGMGNGDKSSTFALADFIIHAGTAVGREGLLAECLWRGIPCLLHAEDATTFDAYKPGALIVDMRDSHEFLRAVLTMLRPATRRSLIDEAIAQPIRTWDEYAAELTMELANDRLADNMSRSTSFKPKSNVALQVLGKRPKLSICISTYNRAGWLAVNLRNLFEQLPAHDGSIELVVVDNTSPDETPQVVKPYLSRSDFRYHRNPANVGMLGNLAVTSQVARGEYVWILGDDDLTRPGTISKVLKVLNSHDDLSLIYMNYGYTFEQDPERVVSLQAFLNNYNVLEPEGDDKFGTVASIAAGSENFYTAIYCIIFRRDHAMRAYGQDTSGRIFSTIESCIPTSFYILNFMADLPAYWIGSHALIMNSNVSWVPYSPLFELEHFPRAWDLAEAYGTPSHEVDKRREDRLPHTVNAWLTAFQNDEAGNCAYIDAGRVLMRIKYIDKLRDHIPSMYAAYKKAHANSNPAATVQPETLFAAFRDLI